MQSQSAAAGSTLTFTIPAPTQSVQRGSKVIPSGTTSILIGYQGQVGSLPPTFIGGSPAPSTVVIVATVNVPSSACVLQSNGAYLCTVTVTFPVGVLDIYIEAFGGPNGTGTLLASSLTVAQVNPSGALTAPGTNTPITVTSPSMTPAPAPPPVPQPVALSPSFLQFTSQSTLSLQVTQAGNASFTTGPVSCFPQSGQFKVGQTLGTILVTNLNPTGTFLSCSMQILGTSGLSNVVKIVVGTKSFTGTFTEFAIPTGNAQPRAIALGPDGNLWFVEQHGNNVGRIT
ncbi:MAG: hypothetical protein JO359_01405, partial [Candidatus Eremiobacteraeota bacterium]|nr:hypothetical protein [Candidatus Eremiobacteraeota bacterium]